MSFRERMTTETGTPMPRWLYLALKPVETVALAVGVSALTGLPALPVAWAVVALYVGLGLWLWYRAHRVTWLGPGSLTGDALYHTLPSLPAPIMVAHRSVAVTWTLLAVVVGLWWLLDTAGYGPMRAPGAA